MAESSPRARAASPERRRRPRNSLTLEKIVSAAIDLVEAEGLPALSIRSVAARVGTAPMAVYNHVAGRAELELAMLEQVTAALGPAAAPEPAPAADPAAAPAPVGSEPARAATDQTADADGAAARERFTIRFRSLHDHFTHARWALPLLVRGDLVPVGSFAFADACIGDLLELGLSPADAIYGYGLCWHLTLGELLDRHPDARSGTDSTQRDRALATLNAQTHPNYVHVLEVLDPTDAPPPCQFPRSFAILLAGLLTTRAS